MLETTGIMSSPKSSPFNSSMPSWGQTLDTQKSALRWDIKRAIKSMCNKLAEIGEECFVVTVNTSNCWVGHIGTIRGEEYIEDKSHILYDFLEYCQESQLVDLDISNELEQCSDAGSESSEETIDKNNDKKDNECTPISLSAISFVTEEDDDDESDDKERISIITDGDILARDDADGDINEADRDVETHMKKEGINGPNCMPVAVSQITRTSSKSDAKTVQTSVETGNEDVDIDTVSEPGSSNAMQSCPVCGFFSKCKMTQVEHISAHDDISVCSICGEITTSEKTLQQHMEDAHAHAVSLETEIECEKETPIEAAGSPEPQCTEKSPSRMPSKSHKRRKKSRHVNSKSRTKKLKFNALSAISNAISPKSQTDNIKCDDNVPIMNI